MRRRTAFTLLEMLVVVGIIVVLAAILIPSLSRVRNQSKQIECLNNMRQIGQAILTFAQNNNDKFPRPGVEVQPDDWIHWEEGGTILNPDPHKDPSDLPLLNKGVIVPILGGTFNPNLFTCPVDNPDAHPKASAGAGQLSGAYPYSYSVNELVCKRWPQPGLTTLQVVNPSQKILLIDEASETVNNGGWNPDEYGNGARNVLSYRHDRTIREGMTYPNGQPVNINVLGQGNVVYCDAHAESISRANMYQPIYTDPRSRSTKDTLNPTNVPNP